MDRFRSISDDDYGFIIDESDPDRMHDDPDWHNDRAPQLIPYNEVFPDGEGTDDDWEEDR